MIGIVIVSHSASLAQGVCDLLEQMTQGAVPVAAAGGTDIEDAPLGTDPMRVLAACEHLFADPGVEDVVIFMDLGSALMSAEAAREFMDEILQPRIHLSPAPLVEGALAGAVRAQIGGKVSEILADARDGLSNKILQIEGSVSPGDASGARQTDGWSASPDAMEGGAGPIGPGDPPTERFRLPISNRLGLHARPAARIVQLLARHDVEAWLEHQGREVSANGLNQILTLGVRGGDTLSVSLRGREAGPAREALQALARENFGDPPDPGADAGPPVPGTTGLPHAAAGSIQGNSPRSEAAALTEATRASRYRGAAVFPGIVIGRPWVLRRSRPIPQPVYGVDPEQECGRLDEALARAVADLKTLEQVTLGRLGTHEAAIFTAQSLMILDPGLRNAAIDRIRDESLDAATAWHRALEAVRQHYQATGDEFFQRRADDLEDAGQRVLQALMGDAEANPPAGPGSPAIVVAADLTPSDVAQLEPGRVLGLVVGAGGSSSHATILARALGLPTVVGVGPRWRELGDATELVLDADSGELWVDPDPAQRLRFSSLGQRSAERRAAEHAKAMLPACMRSGEAVPVFANIGHPAEIPSALIEGAEGVGLFRSELLFLDRDEPPSEAEQYACYRQAALALEGRPLVVRTLDVGGDKPLKFAPMPLEANPFLGLRGLRYCLEHPGLFVPQLRALLRVATEHPLRLLFPMVSAAEELDAVEALLHTVADSLRDESVPVPSAVPWGIMVETPAAVWSARDWGRRVDFFSIGSNDLAQYVMAADRGNERVADLSRRLQPSLLRAIASVVDAGHAAGIPVSVCGELASDPDLAELLLGLGVDSLSMSAPSIPAVKSRIRRLDSGDAKQLADRALAAPSAQALQALLADAVRSGKDRRDRAVP